MKSAKLLASLLLLVCSLSFFSCSKQGDLPTETKDILTQGAWKINYYFANQDNTVRYSDYSFQFSPNGTLVCSDATTQLNGTWKIIRNMNNADWLEMNVSPVNHDLQQLNLNWKITDVNFQAIGMSADSPTPSQLRISKF